MYIMIFMYKCAIVFFLFTLSFSLSAGIPAPLKKVLEDRCVDCHDEDLAKADFDLTKYMNDFNIERDHDIWVEVEAMIAKKRMPPEKKKPLNQSELKVFGNWFEKEFVIPGGIQHAGTNLPRRLTREELQNTLEDILHLNLRETVTNSRLHIIPESIIEKFFAEGVLGKSGFSNDASVLNKDPVNLETFARCFNLILSRVDSSEKSKMHLFGTLKPETISISQVPNIIKRFGHLAFRRPLTSEETVSFTNVYKKMQSSGNYNAFKSSFLAILLSPSFLYRFEETKATQSKVSGKELATRLSYFLWSSPPDKELYRLGVSGEILKPSVLTAQVKRMLADPKRISLAENMGGEWFDYKKLRRQSSMDKRSDKMSGFYRTQYEEALLFFDSLIQYKQSLFSIVDADWAFLNRHQSGIYKMSTTKKNFDIKDSLPAVNIHYRSTDKKVLHGKYEYRHEPLNLVKLNDKNRGGFIGLGSTMSVTSTENRTSPIRRGAWVMERILGFHFKVPKDIPDLEESKKKAKSSKKQMSDKDILLLHSSQKGCAACHKYIDPIGFGLDQFDQLGIDRPVSSAKSKVIGGEVFKWTPAETTKVYSPKTWKITTAVKTGKELKVTFQWTHGSKGLDIKNVRLESGKIILKDNHHGFTGGKNRNNVWKFKIPKSAPTTGWKLSAEVKGSQGIDSHGKIMVGGEIKYEGEIYTLPNGKTFSSPAELKKELLTGYKNRIVRNVVERVLAYALGRKIEPVDRPAIRKIIKNIENKGYQMNAVIEEVALSYPFLHKEAKSSRDKK